MPLNKPSQCITAFPTHYIACLSLYKESRMCDGRRQSYAVSTRSRALCLHHARVTLLYSRATRVRDAMSHPITLSILNAYFSRVYSLHAYLDTILIPQIDKQVNDVLLLSTDPPSYAQFISHSYVAFSGDVPPSGQPQFIMTQSFDSMRVVRPIHSPCLG